VYFRESTTESFEPHYDIFSGKEIWKAYPVSEFVGNRYINDFQYRELTIYFVLWCCLSII